jgi:hypothetical protein
MNDVVVQDGYSIPFAGTRRKKRKGRRGSARHLSGWQNKMKVCAKKWSGGGSYKAHMKTCLRSGR